MLFVPMLRIVLRRQRLSSFKHSPETLHFESLPFVKTILFAVFHPCHDIENVFVCHTFDVMHCHLLSQI